MPFRTTVLLLTLLIAVSAQAQEFARDGQMEVVLDVPEITTFAGVGVGGFVPMRESFRVNYSTDLAGLPIEILAFVQFPLSEQIFSHVGMRFIRRTADFISEAEIRMVQLEPSIRYYVQPPTIVRLPDANGVFSDVRRELGLFLGAGGQISRSTVYGVIQETPDGEDPQRREVTKDHYNLGVGLDVGLSYPATETQYLDFGIHVSTYLNDPVKLGGLGNLGGVSFNVAYRFGF